MSCSPSPATSDEGSQDGKDKKPKKNRCHTCKKKVGLTGTFINSLIIILLLYCARFIVK